MKISKNFNLKKKVLIEDIKLESIQQRYMMNYKI